MSRRARSAALGAIVAAAVLTGSPAGAGEHAVTGNTIADPCGDSKAGHADIKSVSMVVAAPGQGGNSGSITWTIVACGSFATPKAPCVHVRSLDPAGVQWAVCRGNPKDVAPGCIISIFLSRPYPVGGGCDGAAGATRPNAATIVYRVPRKTFNPGKLKPPWKSIAWQARVQDYPQCSPTPCDETAYGRLGL